MAAAAVAMVLGSATLAQADDVVRVVENEATRTGGGATVIAGNSHSDRYQLSATQPLGGERWWAFATNMDKTNPGTLKVYAICARVVSTPTLTTPISG
ncbi:hypothetical protein ACFU3O_14490 [Streptomyces antibioticus]|uniref:hypothetical protein n=1 Tax=Streptomyces antibioticus TaxID=1890 RepID=UPI0036B2C9B7